MLHAPDYLGYESAISMAANPDLLPIVKRALRMKKVGNDLMAVIGGREIHPVSACVGGFYAAPPPSALKALLPDLKWGLDTAIDTVRWAAGLDYPEFEVEYEFVSLSHPDEYPFNEGSILSSTGLDVPMEEFDQHYVEEQAAHSNALHARRVDSGNTYMVGPQARFNLNFEKLSATARDLAEEIGLELPVRNPFHSLIIRSLEIVHAFEEAVQLVEEYKQPRPSRTEIPSSFTAGEGAHATEAPRGLLFHRYKVDEEGLITFARIVPPTSQNQPRIEADLWQYVPEVIQLPLEEATHRCEQLVRCYDPCISCATHFLKLDVVHE
jgi:coenzyme F420-reducing hydrogenase alpha subunit